MLWKRPLLLRVGVRLEPVLPGRCRPATPRIEAEEETALVARWTVDCGRGGLAGEKVAVRGLGEAGSDALVRIALADGGSFRAVLGPDASSFLLPSVQDRAGVAAAYLALGTEHLLTGWDHLAFLLGLVLLVGSRRRLLGTITAFTLGHSVTLSLAALSLVRLPPAPIEAAIALSILALAVELARRDRPTLIGRRPWLMAAGFGLLHGLGFAGALAQVGLPPQEIPFALLSFNVGIELAQVGFVAAVIALGMALRPLLRRLPAWSTAVPTYAIGTLAACWVLERLAAI
ncbi:MAG TPA: HupE/UreJ family protein [Thermoanaerobaculia bacterium]|nr:HupE/UreJ family protein [Thermoanaerobaculia bacterium]